MTVSRFTAKIKADIKNFSRKIDTAIAKAAQLQEELVVKVVANIKDVIADFAKVEQAKKELARDVVVKVEANLNDFLQDMLQAKALAQELDREKISIDVNLKDDILDDILRLMYELEALAREKVKIKVVLDTDLFYTQLMMVRAEMEALMRETVKIKVKLDTSNFDIASLQALIASLDAQSANIKIDVDMSEVIAAITEVKLAILSLRDVTVDIHADIKDFLAGAAVVQKVSKKLNNKNIIVKIWVDFTDAMQNYATVVRAFQEVGQQMLGGSLMAFLPALVPIVSTLVGLVGNLGVMLGVAATSAFALVTALGASLFAVGGFAAVAIPTISKLFDETAKLTKEQENARQSWLGFKAIYEDLVKKTEQPVLTAFTTAMHTATKILQQLEPMFMSTADAVAKLMDSLNRTIDTAPLQSFFAFLNKDAANLLTIVAEAVGYLFQGLLNMMTAFAPLAIQTANGFRDMAAGFAEWAYGLQESERFKALIDYVNMYMPIMRQAFKDLTVGIIEFFAAFAGQSEGFIQGFANMTARFREWATALSENQSFQTFLSFIEASTPKVLSLLGNLWNVLINVGAAMAPIGIAVLDLTNKFLSWFNSTMEGNKVFATLVAILPVVLGVITALVPVVIGVVSVFGNLVKIIPSVVSMFKNFQETAWKIFEVAGKVWDVIKKVGEVVRWLATPVGLAVAAVALFVAALVDAYKNVESFRETVQSAWNNIKALATKVFGGIAKDIKAAFDTIVSFAQSQLAKFSGLWETHGSTIRGIVAALGTALVGILEAAMSIILTAIDVGWSAVTGVVKTAWTIISGVVDAAIDLVLGVVKAGMQLLQGDWKGAWDTIVSTAESIGQTIVSTLRGVIGNVRQAGVDIINGLISGITETAKNLYAKAKEIADTVTNTIKGALKIKSPSRVMIELARWIPAGVAVGITNNLNVVRTAAQLLAKAAAPDFSSTVAISKSQIEAAQKTVSKAIAANESEIRQIKYDAEKERLKVQQDAIKEANDIRAGAAKEKRKLTKAEEKEINKIMSNAAAERVEIAKKAGQDVAAVQARVDTDKLQALSDYVANEKKLQRMSAAEEAAFWKYSATAFKNGTDAKAEALINHQNAHATAMKEQFETEKSFIDMSERYANLSLAKKLELLEQYAKNYEKGSEEQIYYEEQAYAVKKEIYDKSKALVEDYLAKVKSVYQRVIDEEKRLRDEVQKTHDDRTKQIENTFGLFNEAKLTEMVTYKDDGSIDKQVDLLANLRSQVEAIQGWTHDLTTLEMRGLDAGLIEELQAMGAGAAAEIDALTRMSADQLVEYEMLWETKSELARTQATKELTGLREDTEKQIAELHANAKTELDGLALTFETEMREIREGTEEEFDILNATLPDITKNAMQSMLDGMKSMKNPILKEAASIASALKSTLSSAMSIPKPSMVIDASIPTNSDLLKNLPDLETTNRVNASSLQLSDVTGSIEQTSRVSLGSVKMPEAAVQEPAPVNVHVVNEWDGEQVITYIDQQKSSSHRMNVFKKGR